MAKANKKPKYPETRDMQSIASKESNITYYLYTSAPKLDISINKDLPKNVVRDLKHAIDDVLNFYGL